MLSDAIRLRRTHGRDARRQLHVVDVVERQLVLAEVQVKIDHAGHHVLAVALDDAVAGEARLVVFGGFGERVEAPHLRNHVSFDEDVEGAASGPAVAWNHHHVADHEALVGAFGEVAEALRLTRIRSGLDLFELRRRRSGDERRAESEGQHLCHAARRGMTEKT